MPVDAMKKVQETVIGMQSGLVGAEGYDTPQLAINCAAYCIALADTDTKDIIAGAYTGSLVQPAFTKHDNPTINKAKDDEPILVFLGRDVITPAIGQNWCTMAELLGTPPEKIRGMRYHIQAIQNWEGHKKIPD